jgi:hypothetical protein
MIGIFGGDALRDVLGMLLRASVSVASSVADAGVKAALPQPTYQMRSIIDVFGTKPTAT